MKKQYKFVLFDLGGVVIDYKDHNKYLEFAKIIKSNPELLKRFVEFEKGRISLMDVEDEFLQLFGITHKEDIENSALKKNMSGKNSFVAETIGSLRALGKYKLAILTNNGFWNAKKTKTTFFDPEMDFDFVIESCKIGERKPDAAFYQMALKMIGAKGPEECVFIDDLEENCAGSEAVGIKSIWMKSGNGKLAMEQLEEILGEKLLK